MGVALAQEHFASISVSFKSWQAACGPDLRPFCLVSSSACAWPAHQKRFWSQCCWHCDFAQIVARLDLRPAQRLRPSTHTLVAGLMAVP